MKPKPRPKELVIRLAVGLDNVLHIYTSSEDALQWILEVIAYLESYNQEEPTQ